MRVRQKPKQIHLDQEGAHTLLHLRETKPRPMLEFFSHSSSTIRKITVTVIVP